MRKKSRLRAGALGATALLTALALIVPSALADTGVTAASPSTEQTR